MTNYLSARVLEITELRAGTELSTDHLAGDTVLNVYSSAEFSELGGEIELPDETVVAYTTKDDDTSTLTLATGLLSDRDVDDEIWLYPATVEKEAMCQIDQEDTVMARVPHSLYGALNALVRDGYDQESVEIYMDGSEWVIHDVIAQQYQLNGGSIEDGTLPDPFEPEAPPGSSPLITSVTGSPNALIVVTEDIAPASWVNYYISTTDGFIEDPGNLVMSTQATVVVLTQMPDGSSLLPDTVYYIRVRAANALGEAPLGSPQMSGKLDLTAVSEIIATKLIAGFILTGKIQVGQAYIDANEGIVIPQPDGGTIRFPVNGDFARITAHLVAKSLTVEGNFNIQGAAQMMGHMVLNNGITRPSRLPSLSASWNTYAESTLYSGGDNADYFVGLAEYDAKTWAVVTNPPAFGSGIRLVSKRVDEDSDTGPGHGDYPLSSYPDVTHGQAWTDNFYARGGLAHIGNYWYLLGQDMDRSGNWYIYRILQRINQPTQASRTAMVVTMDFASAHNFVVGDHINVGGDFFQGWINGHHVVTAVPSSTQIQYTQTWDSNTSDFALTSISTSTKADCYQKSSELYIGSPVVFAGYIPRLGSEGTNLLMVWSSSSNTLTMRKLNNTTLATISDHLLLSLPGRYNWGSVSHGAFGAAGADRYVIQSDYGANFVFNSSYVRVPGEEFTRANGRRVKGMAYDTSSSVPERGERLVSYDEYGQFTRYSKVVVGVTAKAAYTWYDDTGTTHETEASDVGTLALLPRKYLTVETDPAPDVANTDPLNDDKANQIKVYLSNDGGTPRYEATWALGQKSQRFDEILNTGSNPPTSNGFSGAGSTPGQISSLASDANGALIDLLGSGEGRLGPWQWNSLGDTRQDFGSERPGTLIIYTSAQVPLDCAQPQGQAVPRPQTDGALGAPGDPSSTTDTYRALFELWGTYYGDGDGSTTFNLPDYRNRVLLGLGTYAPTMNANEGLAEASRTLLHAHTGTLPNHTHSDTFSLNKDSEAKPPGTGGGGVLLNTTTLTGGVGNPNSTPSITVGTQAKTGANSIPFHGVNLLIKL